MAAEQFRQLHAYLDSQIIGQSQLTLNMLLSLIHI